VYVSAYDHGSIAKKSKSAWRGMEVAEKEGGTDPREVLMRQNLLQ